jgi:hypothetical protein
MTDPRSEYWTQPNRSDILLDDYYAVMTKESFNNLLEYTLSQPSLTYNGKMWKSKLHNRWVLRWVIVYPAGNGVIVSREILIT